MEDEEEERAAAPSEAFDDAELELELDFAAVLRFLDLGAFTSSSFRLITMNPCSSEPRTISSSFLLLATGTLGSSSSEAVRSTIIPDVLSDCGRTRIFAPFALDQRQWVF